MKYANLVSCALLLGASVFIGGLPASAQSGGNTTDASADKEAFLVQPAKVPAGARDYRIVLVATQPDLFASSSRKQPTLSFGSGVTLVDNSMKVNNTGEIEARINVNENLVGGVEVAVTFYSIDGTSAVRRERATLGVIGPLTVGTDQIKVGVDSVRLVRANVEEAQPAGSLNLNGKVKGAFTLDPPAGTLFAENMEASFVVTPAEVRVTNVVLAADKTRLTFNVLNDASRAADITINGLSLDTSAFKSLGGVEGTLASRLTSDSLGTDPVLVVNAHTALEKQEGSEIPKEGDTPATNDGTTNDDTTNDSTTNNPLNTNYTSSGSRTESGSSSSSLDRNPREVSNRDINPTPNSPAQGVSPNVNPQANRWNNSGRQQQGNYVPPPAPSTSNPGSASSGGASSSSRSSVASAVDVGGSATGAASMERTGTGRSKAAGGDSAPDSEVSQEESDEETAVAEKHSPGTDSKGSASWQDIPASEMPDTRMSKTRQIKVSPRVYFADENYQPLAGVVLDQVDGGERQARVWVVLEREDISDAIDRVVARVRIGMTVHELTLVETGEKTGVFHSDKDGVLIATPRPDEAGN